MRIGSGATLAMTVLDTQVHIWVQRPQSSPGHQAGWPWRTATLFTEELDFLSDIDTTWIRGRGIAE